MSATGVEVVAVPRELLIAAAGHLRGGWELLAELTGGFADPPNLGANEEWYDCATELLRTVWPDYNRVLDDDAHEAHPGTVEIEARSHKDVGTFLRAIGEPERADAWFEHAALIRSKGTTNVMPPKGPGPIEAVPLGPLGCISLGFRLALNEARPVEEAADVLDMLDVQLDLFRRALHAARWGGAR